MILNNFDVFYGKAILMLFGSKCLGWMLIIIAAHCDDCLLGWVLIEIAADFDGC